MGTARGNNSGRICQIKNGASESDDTTEKYQQTRVLLRNEGKEESIPEFQQWKITNEYAETAQSEEISGKSGKVN